ncbi:MAG TPA: M48 family metalloprotease [Acidimicrobiales bacterium]|nr:M48 family metalloprotease [Acidimicrobiales bacterium]
MSPVPTEVLSPLLDDRVAANKRRAMTIMASVVVVLTAVLSLAGALLGAGLAGFLLTAALACGLAVTFYSRSVALVLTRSGARPADPVAHARLHNLVEGLCVTAGLPKPGLYVIDDQAPNAFAVGRSPRDAALVVTTGLTQALNRIELEGVLAHELSQVKSHDTLVSTLAAGLAGAVARVLPAPAGAGLARRATGPPRQALADVTAVSFTRYPPGLIAALEKLRDADTAVRSASAASAHLWLAPALAGGGVDTRPSLEERIAALQEL